MAVQIRDLQLELFLWPGINFSKKERKKQSASHPSHPISLLVLIAQRKIIRCFGSAVHLIAVGLPLIGKRWDETKTHYKIRQCLQLIHAFSHCLFVCRLLWQQQAGPELSWWSNCNRHDESVRVPPHTPCPPQSTRLRAQKEWRPTLEHPVHVISQETPPDHSTLHLIVMLYIKCYLANFFVFFLGGGGGGYACPHFGHSVRKYHHCCLQQGSPFLLLIVFPLQLCSFVRYGRVSSIVCLLSLQIIRNCARLDQQHCNGLVCDCNNVSGAGFFWTNLLPWKKDSHSSLYKISIMLEFHGDKAMQETPRNGSQRLVVFFFFQDAYCLQLISHDTSSLCLSE